MARGFAYAYKAGQRPYGQPADGFRDASPRPEAVGKSRNVQRVQRVSLPSDIPEANTCSALTRSGAPCKGRPVTGSDLCVFHTEKE